jgi:trans-2,3-dihydro-3-hydroxyanthranilate isomerase
MDGLSEFSKSLDIIGVHAFAIDDNGNIWCRNFAPACGIPEESATGTSNGALGAYLSAKRIHDSKNLTFTVRQGDWMGRPSRIFVQTLKTNSTEVWVGGEAVIVLEGEILIK